MSVPANITAAIVIAGFGIAGGVTILYNILTNPVSEPGEPYPYHTRYHQNQSSSCQERSPTPPSRSRSPKRLVLRAISPPTIQIPVAVPAVSAASNLENEIPHRRGNVTNCQLCKGFMRNLTIELDCRHIFHDECYTIWRYDTVMNNPHAKLCPIC